jgi:hypothetical protein
MDGPSEIEKRRAALSGQGDKVMKISKVLCKSGKFETGEGCCAPICMESLDVARDNCRRCTQVHGSLARDIIVAIS